MDVEARVNNESLYPPVTGEYMDDNGTMPENVEQLANAIIGHKIVRVDQNGNSATLTLDNDTTVELRAEYDCCAYTDLQDVIQHLPSLDHVITAVRPSGDYTEWHILADLGEVLELKVAWSCGNPFYYAYGFSIVVDGKNLRW